MCVRAQSQVVAVENACVCVFVCVCERVCV